MATINGHSSNETLFGTPESDIIDSKLGDDILDGLGGADEFVFNNVFGTLYFPTYDSNNNLVVSDIHVYSTDGLDIIKNFSLSENDSVISIDPQTNNRKYEPISVNVKAAGGKGQVSEKTEYIFGTTESDTISGTSASDIIDGLSGNDILYGNEFNDSLYGGPGNDSLYGGANNDKLYGGPGNDYLSGGLDSDELYGEAGDDILDGSGGGSAGYIDTLIGGTGNDTYIVDTLEIIRGKFGDQITEKLNEGTDTVHSPISHKLGDNLENLVLTGSSDINGSGNALDNRIEGNAGQNFLVGGDGNDHLLGYAGNDILAGEAGNDTVSGGAGNDFLNGGAGSDTLTGGAGSDTLTGGAGADRFVFSSPSDGIDIIKDLSSVESDKIQISKTGFGATSTNQFSYNNNTGALSFQETQFATLESKPSFIPNLHIELV